MPPSSAHQSGSLPLPQAENVSGAGDDHFYDAIDDYFNQELAGANKNHGNLKNDQS